MKFLLDSFFQKKSIVRFLRATSLFVGFFSLIASSIFFWGVFAAEGSFHLSRNGMIIFLGVCIWNAASMFFCLWGANKQSVINYFRLIGFPLAVLVAMQFDGGPAFGLFYFAVSFIVTILLWNMMLSGVQHFIYQRGSD